MFRAVREMLPGRGSPAVKAALAQFERDGYAVLRGEVPPSLCDAFWSDVEKSLATDGDLRIVSAGKPVRNAERAQPYSALWSGRGDPERIIDIEAQVARAPQLMLHESIASFLRGALGGAPTCIQTLTYSHSSQQAAHSDKFLVSPRAAGPYDRNTLIASWVALEASDDGNGALIVWPGSHRLPKRRLKDDFAGKYGAYVAHLKELCADAGIEPIRFYAEQGDVLFWHGDLVHAGGKIEEPSRTRKSLVCHYAQVKGPSKWADKRVVKTQGGSYYMPAV
ncbi:MAG: phytanoyl-CoA dioxygenase family protein [Pseudomonadota bacterium]